MRFFRVKPDTWFLAGSIAELIDDYREDPSVPTESGLFRGVRICEVPEAEAYPLGQARIDEELCSFDEFEEIDCASD